MHLISFPYVFKKVIGMEESHCKTLALCACLPKNKNL